MIRGQANPTLVCLVAPLPPWWRVILASPLRRFLSKWSWKSWSTWIGVRCWEFARWDDAIRHTKFDFYGILQTCRLLDAVSRDRALWVIQYRQYMLLSPHFEQPLESYSARELEQWVLVRRKANLKFGYGARVLDFSRWKWLPVGQEYQGGWGWAFCSRRLSAPH